MDYQIIDNFLPQEEYLKLYDLMTSSNFAWYYSDSVAFEESVDLGDWYQIHLLYIRLTPHSEHFLALLPILEKLDIKALIRAKANFYPNLGKHIENEFHVDFPFQHKGCIYYLNTNNGPTILSDGTKIDAIANRALLFDPSKPHGSTHCTDAKVRLNINFNYF